MNQLPRCVADEEEGRFLVCSAVFGMLLLLATKSIWRLQLLFVALLRDELEDSQKQVSELQNKLRQVWQKFIRCIYCRRFLQGLSLTIRARVIEAQESTTVIRKSHPWDLSSWCGFNYHAFLKLCEIVKPNNSYNTFHRICLFFEQSPKASGRSGENALPRTLLLNEFFS